MGLDMSGLGVLERPAFPGWDGEPLEGFEQRSEVIWPRPATAKGGGRKMSWKQESMVTWTKMVAVWWPGVVVFTKRVSWQIRYRV